MTKSSNDKYTDPELRDQVKEEVQAGDKGGEPGQWSARKAQMMAKEYKARGGGYKTDKKDDKAAQHLDQWTKEDWQTKDGDGNARTEEGTHRYLPKRAWEQMDDSEKEATDKKKMEGSREGEQYVSNTDKAKKARRDVSEEGHAENEDENENEQNENEESNDDSESQEEEEDDNDEEEVEKEDDPDKTPKATTKASSGTNKAKGRGSASKNKKDNAKSASPTPGASGEEGVEVEDQDEDDGEEEDDVPVPQGGEERVEVDDEQDDEEAEEEDEDDDDIEDLDGDEEYVPADA